MPHPFLEAAPGNWLRHHQASKLLLRLHLRRLELGLFHRALRDLLLLPPSCPRRLGREPSSLRSHLCVIGGLRLWCAKPDLLPGRLFQLEASTLFQYRQQPMGLSEQRDRSCVCVNKSRELDQLEFHNRLQCLGLGRLHLHPCAEQQQESAECCRQGVSNLPPRKCRGSQVLELLRRLPRLPTLQTHAYRPLHQKHLHRHRLHSLGEPWPENAQTQLACGLAMLLQPMRCRSDD